MRLFLLADVSPPELLSIGTSRFLKTIKARHPNGPLLIKIFLKSDPSTSLLVHRRRLKGPSDHRFIVGPPAPPNATNCTKLISNLYDSQSIEKP